MAKNKKVFLTTLSVTKKEDMPAPDKNSYFVSSEDHKRYCTGTQQQEPGAKYILSEVAIDKIVILASKETISEEDEKDFRSLQNDNGEVSLKTYYDTLPPREEIPNREKPTFAFFCHRIAEFVLGKTAADEQLERTMMTPHKALLNKDISVVLIVYRDNSNDHLPLLTEALMGTEQEKTELYMDAQGGARTTLYVNNALLQMLSQLQDVYHFKLNRVVATDFLKKEQGEYPIKDETEQYKIVELVSGMSAFLKYGKADLLISYFKNTKNKTVKDLCRAMKGIDEAIMLSKFEKTAKNNDKNTEKGPQQDSLLEAIDKFRGAVEKLEEEVVLGEENGLVIFRILLNGIKYTYGDLLKDELDYLSVISWCMRIGDVGDALRILEAHLPEYIVRKGILYYAKNENEKEAAKAFFQEQKASALKKEKYRFGDINHYYINQYFRYTIANNNKKVFPVIDKDHFSFYRNQYYYDEIGQAKWALPLYSCKKDKFQIAKILTVYYWLCDLRNGVMHSQNRRDTTFREIEENIKWIMKRIGEESYSDSELFTLPGNVLENGETI